jgi:hypothetical protein
MSDFRIRAFDLHHDNKEIDSQVFSDMGRAETLVFLHFSDKANQLFRQIYGLEILPPHSIVNWVPDENGKPLSKEQKEDKYREFMEILKSDLNKSKKIFWIF